MTDIGSHVLIAHLRTIADHHEAAHLAAQDAHRLHRRPELAPEPEPEPIELDRLDLAALVVPEP